MDVTSNYQPCQNRKFDEYDVRIHRHTMADMAEDLSGVRVGRRPLRKVIKMSAAGHQRYGQTTCVKTKETATGG